MNMADVGEYLATLQKEFEMLKDFVTTTNTSKTPQFSGTAAQLTPVFTRLGLWDPAAEEKDVPGWIDNLAAALKSSNPVLLRQNRKSETVPARWYEYLEDGSLDKVIGDYLYAPLTGINAFVTAGERGRRRAQNIIDDIQRNYPVSKMSTEDYAKQVLNAEKENEKTRIEKAAEVAKENIRNTPIKLKYKRGAEEGEIEIIPAMTSNFPWYNLGGLDGRMAGEGTDEEGEAARPAEKPSKRKRVPEYMRYGGISSEYDAILKGVIQKQKDYAIELKLHGEAINKNLKSYKDKPLDKETEYIMYG
jgi:hypothetical protein